MRFTRKVKKALSVVLTGALVVAGVNFGMTREADAANVDFTLWDAEVENFNGDGTYTVVGTVGQYTQDWAQGKLLNCGYFKSDQAYSISDVTFTINNTYVFSPFEQGTVEAESDGKDYKVDLGNCWDGLHTDGEIVYVSQDKKARILQGSNQYVLRVAENDASFNDGDASTSGTETNVTAFSMTFTYKFTGSAEDQPTIDETMQAKGAYLEWTGNWKKENNGNNTTTVKNQLSSKTTFDIDAQGGYAIDITRLDLSGATKPTLEVEFAANEDKLQVYPSITSTENPLTTTDTSGDYKVELDASVTQLRITSYANKLVVTGISIYSDTEVYAKASLSSNVTKAEALTQADYTADSWTALQTALTAAKAVAADASLADINAANKALKDAIAGLKAAGTSTPTPAPGVPTPVPGGNATPTPAPGGDATPTPAPGGETTPTPAPGGDTTPTPAPGGDTTPTPAPGGDATPTPAPGGNATPTPAPGGDATPTPTPGGNATPTPTPNGDNAPTTVGLAKNAKATVGNFTYKVTKTSVKSAGKVTKGTVTVTAMSKKGKKAKKLSVPATVKAGGATYNVTAVGAKAMKGAKATSVTLGKNVKSIGKSAFASCKKLSKLSIKAKLSSVAKGAFKGCKKKIKVSGTAKKQNVKKLKKSGYKKFK